MRVAPSATVMPHVNWQARCFRICRHSESMIATPHRPVFLTSFASCFSSMVPDPGWWVSKANYRKLLFDNLS